MWDTIVDRDYVNTGYVCACNTMKQGLFNKTNYFWLAARVELFSLQYLKNI